MTFQCFQSYHQIILFFRFVYFFFFYILEKYDFCEPLNSHFFHYFIIYISFFPVFVILFSFLCPYLSLCIYFLQFIYSVYDCLSCVINLVFYSTRVPFHFPYIQDSRLYFRSIIFILVYFNATDVFTKK